MKRLIVIVFCVFSLIGFCYQGNARAYTAFISVDSSLNLDMLDYIDVFVSGVTDPLTDLVLNAYYDDGKDINGDAHSFSGAIPAPYMGFGKYWDIFLTNFGAEASKEDFGLGELNLQEGVVFSLTYSTVFDVGIILASNDDITGSYTEPYIVTTEDLAGDKLYTVSNVPIPGAIWLLGSGFLGLVTIRRRRRAKG